MRNEVFRKIDDKSMALKKNLFEYLIDSVFFYWLDKKFSIISPNSVLFNLKVSLENMF